MVFTAPQFLYGLIFTLVPLVIHIIAKKRIRTVKFSSIMFLLKAAQKQVKRYKIKDLLLLILRMLIIVFLVLSIARPVKYKEISDKDSEILKKKRKSIIVIIDNSLSMEQIISGENLLKTAKRVAEKIIKSQLKEGDNLSVIIAADKTPVKFFDLTYNFESAIEIIKNTRFSFLKPNIFKCLKLAENLLDTSIYPNRIIYLITDLQKINFTDSEGNFINKALKIKYPVFLVNLKTKKIKNSAIIEINVPRVLNFVGDTILIRPNIKNFSDEKNNLIIKTFINNEPFGQKTAEINPESTLWLDFENKIKKHGFLSGYSEIADGDNLIQDNKNYFVIYVPEYLKIAVTEQKKEMFYVINALNPSYILNKKVESPLKIIYYNKIPEKYSFDILIISQDYIPAKKVRFFKNFLKSKKSLLIFPTPTLDINNFNNIFSRTKLLPGAIFNKVNIEKSNPLTLEFIDYTHPAFEIFKDYSSFKHVKIFNYYKFNIEFSSLSTKILARFSNGAPAIIEYSPFGAEIIGSGKIILFLFSPVPDSTELVYRPSFPPLIHQIIKYLTMPQLFDTLNKFKVGQTLEDIKNILEISSKKVDIKCLTDELKNRLSGDTIIAPGVFKINSYVFAVNIDYSESNLETINYNELKENYKNINFVLFNSEAEIDKRIVAGMYGKQYWQMFLIIALVLLITEMFIANQWQKLLKFKLWK